MRGAVLAVLMGLSPAGAQDLPMIPFGLPESSFVAEIDPILVPRLDGVTLAFRAYQDSPGQPEDRARLAQVLAAEEAALLTEVRPQGRHHGEFLAFTLHEAEAALGREAAEARADLAVAIERQLAANAVVFGSYYPGTEEAVVTNAHSARQVAIGWALDAADAARTAGDRGAAERRAERALLWAQTLSQGGAARASVRRARSDGALPVIEDLTERMRDTAFLEKSLPHFNFPASVERSARDSLAAEKAFIAVTVDALRAEEVDLAASLFPRPLTLDEIRAALRPEEALVLVFEEELTFAVFAVSRDGFAWHRTVLNMLEINDLATQLLAAISGWRARSAVPLEVVAGEDTVPSNTEDLMAASLALYAELLAPSEGVITGKARLLISPTGTVAALPWHLLARRGAGPGGGFETVEWLVHDHAVLVLPAVELLAQRPPADPAGPAARDLTYLGFGAPSYGSGQGRWVEDTWAGFVAGLPALPEAAGEVIDVGALYSEAGRLVLTGNMAREDRLMDLSRSGRLAGFDVVHFATHGLVMRDHPGVTDAMLALAPAEREPPYAPLTVSWISMDVPDGALQEYEIRHLRMAAELVILSACKTAVGWKSDRDGIEGLAAAFLYAGARRVLATHWPVNSEAAVDLVTTMMAADPEMTDPARALQQAMLAEIAKGGRRADPSWWAAFSLIGAPWEAGGCGSGARAGAVTGRCGPRAIAGSLPPLLVFCGGSGICYSTGSQPQVVSRNRHPMVAAHFTTTLFHDGDDHVATCEGTDGGEGCRTFE